MASSTSTSSSSSPDPANEAPHTRRATIACTNCRNRKVKCVRVDNDPHSRVNCKRCTYKRLNCDYMSVQDQENYEESSRSGSYSPPDVLPYGGAWSSHPGMAYNTNFTDYARGSSYDVNNLPQRGPNPNAPYGSMFQSFAQPSNLSTSNIPFDASTRYPHGGYVGQSDQSMRNYSPEMQAYDPTGQPQRFDGGMQYDRTAYLSPFGHSSSSHSTGNQRHHSSTPNLSSPMSAQTAFRIALTSSYSVPNACSCDPATGFVCPQHRS